VPHEYPDLAVAEIERRAVYASDYPHEHGDGLPRLLDRLNDSERRGLFWRTAAERYGLTR
jgi:predicted TIM-barrel fold metal-dependent hydrolase